MTTTLTHHLQDERLAAGLTLVVAAAGLAFANFAGNGDNGGPAAYAIGLALVVVVAAVLYGRVLPTVARPARAAWILAALGVVSCVVFWSGLPFAFGVGAIYAGSRAGRTGPVALGAVVTAAAFAACVAG